MKTIVPTLIVVGCLAGTIHAQEWKVLFDGENLKAWEYDEGGWEINDNGAMVCNLETVTRNGQTRTRGMGYIWTKESFSDFELQLDYKLSEGANSGVFFRTDPKNPVQGGFEIQLMDDEGIKKTHGNIGAKHLNGAFYDAQPASSNPANPAGEWNEFTLKCVGSHIEVSINGTVINEVDVDRWDTAGMNPDGTKNKFKTALKELPREGRIGFQNHGQVVWFKDIRIRAL